MNVLEKRLEALDRRGCRRTLNLRAGADFSSNDYLGFAQDPELRKRVLKRCETLPLGSSGSRLLRGHLEIFEKAEAELARFCSREAALIFSTGYQANVGLLSSLLTKEDVVFSDEKNHASIIDGIRLSGAQREVFRHSDLSDLRARLKNHHSVGFKLIVVESLYGMDGDFAPLAELADIAEEFSAGLVVDEAHATGIWGGDGVRAGGGGRVQALGLEKKVLATVHPGGKAMGVGGAWICGDAILTNYLVQTSRAFIFSTAPMPMLAAALLDSVPYWHEVGKGRAQDLLLRASIFKKELSKFNSDRVKIPKADGLIIPAIVGDNLKSLEIASQFQADGFDVRAIRPPTVPQGQARLRITLNWNQTEEDWRKFYERFHFYFGN